MDDGELRDAVLSLLDEHTVMSLATLHDGRPYAVSLMYARDGLRLYWFSSARSRHSRALAAEPAASVSIAHQYDDFEVIRGLQMTGLGRIVENRDEHDRGLARLAGRYPFLERFRHGPGRLLEQLGNASVYRFDADAITLVDNRRGFGFKRTLRC